MSGDEDIDVLERRIDSLRADVKNLEAVLAGRKAALAENAASATTPPPGQEGTPVAAQPTAPVAPVAAAEQSADYPLLHEIHLTPEAPDAPVSSRRAERRSAGRVACVLRVEFTEQTHFFAGLTQDISEGGLFVATYRVLPVGTAVVFGFELPDGARITAHGEVRWVRPPGSSEERPGLGIAFTELSPEAMRQISAFCATRPPLYIEM